MLVIEVLVKFNAASYLQVKEAIQAAKVSDYDVYEEGRQAFDKSVGFLLQRFPQEYLSNVPMVVSYLRGLLREYEQF